EREAFGANDVDALALHFDDVNAIFAEQRIEIARSCEAAAMAVDARLQHSSGASFDASTTRRVMVNSRGFAGEYRRSYCGFSVTPIAQDAGGMQTGYWYSSARNPGLREEPA